MFPKLCFLFLAFFGIIVAAAPSPNDPSPVTITVTAPGSTTTVISQCNTGDVQCCNTVQPASNNLITGLLGLLDIVLEDVTALIGLGCTPISLLGVGQGANCAQQPVCCQNVTFNGLINIGCNSISLRI